ncbi:MAG: TonB-dependent receptor [Desulfuromonadales bacterium]|nr:TonB-dependent receptor [Desulfuromonadales bacterium]
MKNAVLVGCMLGCVAIAHADEDAGEMKKHDLETVTVTATKKTGRTYDELKIPVYSQSAVQESAKATTEVFTREEIEDIKPRDFYDLFSRAAGTATTYQGRKYMNFLSVRGGDSNSVGVIIDGFYIPSSQSSRILAQFPMDAIESVQIVRDSTSLSLGPIVDLGTSVSAPNQGFVIITTRKGTRLDGGVNIDYGSLNTREFQLYHGNKLGNFNYRLTGTINGTDGRSGWYTNQNAASILFNGGYDGETLKINTNIFYQHGKRNMEHSFTNTTNNSYWGYDPMEALWMGITINKLWTPGQVTSFSYSHGMLTDTEVMGTSTPANNPDKIKYTYTGQSDYADNYHVWHTSTIANNTAKIGFQAIKWHEPTGYASWDGKEKEELVLGGYIQDEQRFFGDKLAVDAGVRVDDKYIKHGTDVNGVARSPQNQWAAPSIGASVGGAWKIDGIHKLSARVGYSYADVDPFLTPVKNVTLEAEERYKFEVGLEGNYHPAFNPKLTLFCYDINNYKLSTTQGTGTKQVTLYNQANVTRKGIEVSSSGNLPYGFSYNLNYSHYEFNENTVSITSPHDILSLLLSHRYGPFQTNLTLRYVAPYLNNGFTTPVRYVEVGDFTRLDMNASYDYHISRFQGRVVAYVQNMLNDKYQTINGFPDQGTTFGLRLEAGF